MHAVPLLGTTPAPLDREPRIAAMRAALAEHEVFPRRFSHAVTSGLIITYAHVAIPDGPRVASILAVALAWTDSTVSDTTGMVSVATTVEPSAA